MFIFVIKNKRGDVVLRLFNRVYYSGSESTANKILYEIIQPDFFNSPLFKDNLQIRLIIASALNHLSIDILQPIQVSRTAWQIINYIRTVLSKELLVNYYPQNCQIYYYLERLLSEV